MQTPKLLTISILILIISFLFNISASDDSETTGTLTVDTRPSGLNVYVDGKIAGKTPLKNYAVPAGKRVISVETEPCFKNVLYYSWNRPVFVENGKDTYVEIVPAPILTNLKVEGIAINGKKLENTSIFVDGVNTGIQPGSFEVPVCSKLLEVTDESGRNVVYSSELDLLKGVSVPRNEKNYEITSVSEKKENDIVLFQVPENSNDQNSGLTDSSGSVEKTPFRSPLKTVKKNSEVFGPYKWIGTALILTGAVSAGLGGFFDYKAVKIKFPFCRRRACQSCPKGLSFGLISVRYWRCLWRVLNKRTANFNELPVMFNVVLAAQDKRQQNYQYGCK